MGASSVPPSRFPLTRVQQPKKSALRAVEAERRRLLRERSRRSAPPAHTLLPHGSYVHGARPPFWERQWLATYEVLVQGPLPAPGTSRKRGRTRSKTG